MKKLPIGIQTFKKMREQGYVYVETATHIFIFEFKFNRSAVEAMKQIKDNKYADKYRASGKIIYGIGVNFVSLDKEINGWETEIL
jgi:PD-(D/E)XK nuclease superfamily